MTIELNPDVAASLAELAAARGLTVEAFLREFVAREKGLPTTPNDESASPAPASGMVEENGLFVYKTGRPLPADYVDAAIRRSREERSQHILGKLL